MKTSRAYPLAIAAAMALVATLPNPAGAAAKRPSAKELTRSIAAVRVDITAARNRLAHIEESLAEASAGTVAAEAALTESVRTRDALQRALQKGVAELYASPAAPGDAASLAEALTAVKRRIESQAASVARAQAIHAGLLTESKSLRRQVADKTARLGRLKLALKRATTPPKPRVAPRAARTSGRGIVCPVAGPIRIKNNFAENRSTHRHTGIDIEANVGQAVRAVLPGRIVTPGPGQEGYGQLLVLRDGAGNEWWFAHLSSRSVGPGDTVDAGQTIGRVGCSGRCSGPHLHLEARPAGGGFANPYSLVRAAC